MGQPMHITISDVAREAGVALGTVSNVFNHPEKVREETVKLVRDAAQRLGYAPNQSARMLAGGKNKVFGLILPNLDHGISLQIANGATAEARKHGYNLLIATANNDDAAARDCRDYFLGTQVAGVLVQPPAISGRRPDAPPMPIPFAYLDMQNDVPGYFVGADNAAQGAVVAEHALASGARRIAIVGAPLLRRLKRRLDGARLALETNGTVAFDVIEAGTWNMAQDGHDLGRRLASKPEHDRPDFIIALTDVLATGVISGIRAAGLRVPRDIRVAGCDGNPLAWSGPVPLTTIAPPGYEIGRRGVQYLLQQIAERAEGGVEHSDGLENHQELVRPFLLPRASTGASGAADFADPDLDISGYL